MGEACLGKGMTRRREVTRWEEVHPGEGESLSFVTWHVARDRTGIVLPAFPAAEPSGVALRSGFAVELVGPLSRAMAISGDGRHPGGGGGGGDRIGSVSHAGGPLVALWAPCAPLACGTTVLQNKRNQQYTNS